MTLIVLSSQEADDNDTYTGTNTGYQLHLSGSQISASSAALRVNGFQRTGNIHLHEGGGSPNTNSKELSNSSGVLRWDSHKVWHEGNDGPTSGLNADLLDDGLDSTQFLRKDTDDSAQGFGHKSKPQPALVTLVCSS